MPVKRGSGGEAGRPAPQKDADAYRTIGEVAGELNLPQHVLRFWETRFPQVRPLKRAGGRRLYRPEDVALLRAVQKLLYGEGYTIKGVQRLFAEFGAREVAEALARSAPVPAQDLRPSGPEPDPEAETAMPKDQTAGTRDAGRAFPPPPEEPAGAANVPLATAGRPGLPAKLEGVLAELAECERLLAAARSTRN